jgi:hypothetical protein
MDMNSYLLTKLFYRQLEESEEMQVACTPHHQALFFRIMQVQNPVGWAVKHIDLPTESTMFYTCIGSYKTYKNCLADLLKWELIAQIKASKNQYQARKVSLYTDKWRAFFAEADSKQSPTQDQSTAQTPTNAGSMHGRGTNQSKTEASPAYKTNKLLNEETIKPLNLETFKEDYLAAPSKSIRDGSADNPEIIISTKEDSEDRTTYEYPQQAEKKKVAPKRKVSSAKPKEGSANPKKVLPKPDLLFAESPYADKTLFVAAFSGSEYETASLEYYHELIKNWSESKQARKRDWIATAKNWMLKDFKEGKLVTQSSTGYGKPTQPDTASPDNFTGLGNAVDQYFKRKFVK